jgi:prepilin-type N-terminal cleavage/methylation domain-containing protein
MRRFLRPVPARPEDGFTLVELIVALALIAVVAVGFTVSVGLGFRTVAVARQRQIASELAVARLEHLRNVPYDQVALSSQPVHEADLGHPNNGVSLDGTTYDTNGGKTGGIEPLIVDTDAGQVLHLEDPVDVGATVMEIYQYVTWVDDPTIVGSEDYKRITVVVRYHAPAANGVNELQRSSTIVTPPTVTFEGSPLTTVPGTTTPTTTGSSPTTGVPTTTIPAACPGDTAGPGGEFTIGSSGESEAGYTAAANVTLHMDFDDTCEPLVMNFSNDGVTWGADVTYDPTDPSLSWPLSSGNGIKTVYGQVRDGVGNVTLLDNASITLDASAPTTPGSVAHSVSCSGSNRTVAFTWSASTDAEGNLRGYRVYRSTDGTTWDLLGSTVLTLYSDVHQKSLNSVRFHVVAYDRAGNTSGTAPTPAISLAKNQCS